MSYYFKEIFRKISPDKLEGKRIIALNLLSEIKQIPSAIERSNWIRELGLRLGVSEADLREEMEQLTLVDADNARINANNQRKSAENLQPSASKSRKEILSEQLLALLLKKTEFIAETVKIAAYLPIHDFEFLSVLVKVFADKSADTVNFSDIRSALNSNLRPRLDFLYMLGDFELSKANSDFDLGKEIIAVTKEIEREHYKEHLLKIGVDIKKCEAEGLDPDDLTKEFQHVSKRLMDLSKK